MNQGEAITGEGWCLSLCKGMQVAVSSSKSPNPPTIKDHPPSKATTKPHITKPKPRVYTITQPRFKNKNVNDTQTINNRNSTHRRNSTKKFSTLFPMNKKSPAISVLCLSKRTKWRRFRWTSISRPVSLRLIGRRRGMNGWNVRRSEHNNTTLRVG